MRLGYKRLCQIRDRNLLKITWKLNKIRLVLQKDETTIDFSKISFLID